MEFTVLSHAGLLVEHRGVRIVSDPWLIGSCYWRSWWNFPEPPAALVHDLRPDYVYLTHLHWDHFHGVSLQKLFPPSTKILVPLVPTRRMVKDLEWLGFHDVTEVPHGGRVQLGEDFTLHSYQFGPAVDSAMVLEVGGSTLFNSNDCKLFGLPLKQITDRHRRFDFVFRSHSSASPIPYCIEGYRESFPHLRSQDDYVEEFSRFALSIGARYAIPFASNHCFLHRETVHFNDTAVLPTDVEAHHRALAARSGIDSRCVVMAPGSRWSDASGFDLVPFDYAQRAERLAELAARHAETLERQYATEEETRFDAAAFRAYFERFVAAVPGLLRSRFSSPVVFRTADKDGVHHGRIDLRARRVDFVDGPAEGDIVVETPALVLNDCTRNTMFSVWAASKRLRIRLPTPAHLDRLVGFLLLLDLLELDTLPLRRNFAPRSLGVRLRRWREVVEAASLFFKHKVLRRPFSIAGLYTLPASGGAGKGMPSTRPGAG